MFITSTPSAVRNIHPKHKILNAAMLVSNVHPKHKIHRVLSVSNIHPKHKNLCLKNKCLARLGSNLRPADFNYPFVFSQSLMRSLIKQRHLQNSRTNEHTYAYAILNSISCIFISSNMAAVRTIRQQGEATLQTKQRECRSWRGIQIDD